MTREQIGRYKLPPQNFAKETSNLFPRYRDRNGGDNTVYELEALDPRDMIRDLDTVIRSVIDVDAFNAEIAKEKEEAVYLERVRKTTQAALRDVLRDGDE